MKTTTRPPTGTSGHWYAEELKSFDGQQMLAAAEARENPSAAPGLPPGGAEISSRDADLVSECLKGNDRAWAALIDKYKRLIFSIPIKYGASSADAAEILQSVCVELFCQLSKLHSAESLKSWLVVVTSRKYFQWVKERRVELALDHVEEEHPDAIAVRAPELFEAEREQNLREGVAQLAPRCQELVRLLFYEEPPLPYAEVARRLGLATGSIGFIRGRCLDRLRKILMEKGF